MTPTLNLEDVTFGYEDVPVLDDLSFALRPGSLTGLLGRNGAGKTTLMHVALGLLRPTAGRVELFGEHAWNAPSAVRTRIGFVPQRFEAFPWMVLKDCLKLVGSFYERWDQAFLEQLAATWGLDLTTKIRALSGGQQQQAAILLALGHRPDFLVLDEPVSSLDPAARREFLRTVVALNSEHAQTILFSSHIVSDIERIATDVAILHRGQMVLHEALDTLKEQVQRLQIRSPRRRLPDKLSHPDVFGYRVAENGATALVMGSCPERTAALSDHLQADLYAEPVTLEELLLELTS
jgi:ABC-2 type transport system ATP-binding protein